MSPERFIDLVRVEQESLRRFLLALCGGDESLADDIAQDALVRAYVASGSFLGLSKFSTWLFRIAYNCYVDYQRKLRLDTISSDSQQALSILESLPEKEKASIVLHYFEDRSIKEISSILQIPQGTVKYHLSIGRNHLKSILQ